MIINKTTLAFIPIISILSLLNTAYEADLKIVVELELVVVVEVGVEI